MDTILRYLKQPSTQRALLALLGLIGWQVSPENLESIVGGLVAAFAVIEGLRDEDKPSDTVQPLSSGGGKPKRP